MEEKEKSGLKLIEALKNLFKALFGVGNKRYGAGPQEEDSNEKNEIIKQKLKDLSDELNNEKESALESGDFLKSYILETQKLCVDDLISTAENPDAKRFTPEEFAEIAKAKIDSTLDGYQNSDYIQEQFQDYHNHDPIKLNEAAQSANTILAQKTKDLGFGANVRQLNSTMRSISVGAVEFMMQSPLSHAEKIGLEDSLSNENSNDYSKDMSKDMDNSFDDDSPSLKM